MNQVFVWCKSALFFLVLLMISCASSTSARRNQDFDRPSPKVLQGRLENGLAYYVLNNKNPKNRCYLKLNVNVGSFMERDDELGLAHFVEHLAFDDRSISPKEQLVEWFKRHGMSFGPDANATTSTEYTVYKLDLPTCDETSVRDALTVLKTFAHDLQFRDEAIVKEKNIIDAESKEYFTSQGQFSQRILENLYAGSSYALRPVLGKETVRAAFTKDTIKAFYDRWYHPSLMSIIVVGDFGLLKPQELIAKVFGDIRAKEKKPDMPKITKPDHKRPIFILHEPAMSYVGAIFTLQPKQITRPRFHQSLLKERMTFNLAIFMLKQALKTQSLSRTQLIREPTIEGSIFDEGVYELTLVTYATDDTLESSFMEDFLMLRRAAQFGFSERELDDAKKTFSDVLDQMVIEEGSRGSDQWSTKIIDYIQGKDSLYDPADFQARALPELQSITVKDCLRVVKKALSSGHHYFFATGALEENPKNEERLKKLLKSAQKQKVLPKVPEAVVEFKYHVPDDATITPVAVYTNNEIRSTRLQFANNVQVVLKPTQFKNDEYVLHMVMGDGYAVLDPRDYVIAYMAQMALTEGGLLKHPPEDFPKLLRDKQLSMQMQILERRIEFNATTRKKDFRFTLELIRAFLTDPLYAEASLERLKDRINAYYRELPHNMQAPLQHDFLKALTNNDYRVGRPELSDFFSISRADLLAWHKKYLQQEPLKIVVVGDFNEENVRMDLGSVFGSLPKIAMRPKTKAKTISYKPGVHNSFQVVSGDKASKVRLTYPLAFPTIFPDVRLSLLRDVIHEALRLKLREKKQIAYDTKVSVIDGSEPFMQNWLDIEWSVDKAHAKASLDLVVATLNKMAQHGISKVELTKAKEPLLAQVEQSLTNNHYWGSILINSFATVDTMNWVVHLQQSINKVSVKDISVLLGKYFYAKNASTAIVNAVDK